MHVLFSHVQFPAQLGFFATYAARKLGWQCTFVCEKAQPLKTEVRLIQYKRGFGATQSHSFYARGFENVVAQHEGTYRALKPLGLAPDLVVSHAGLGGSLFLSELYDAKTLSFLEFYYHLTNSDMDFRPEFQPSEDAKLRLILRNAPLLLELQHCAAGYSPTRFQRGLFPAEYRHKIHTIFDGIDTELWRPRPEATREWGGRSIDAGTKIVTYCSRGFESLRGFDMFMRAAKIIYREMPDVVFLVAGADKICYGGDAAHIKPHTSFKNYVLAQDDYDLSKFVFLGRITMGDLARLFTVGDAHIYLTAPFVLSWSMLNAMACGAVVVGSNTPPVTEMIRDGETGLLADFFDPEAIARQTLRVLRDPGAFRSVSDNAMALIREHYSTDVTYPRMVRLYEAVASGRDVPVDATSHGHEPEREIDSIPT